MRLWSLHPSLLDRRALVADWREGLLAQKVLLADHLVEAARTQPVGQRTRLILTPVAPASGLFRICEKIAHSAAHGWS